MFEQASRSAGDTPLWGYRYRMAGRASHRVQVGGFPSEAAARAALERVREQARRERGLVLPITVAEFAATYLAQHDAEPVTISKLSWLLTKSVAAFGDRPITTLRGTGIAAWRMTLPVGHRFEATQALRQVLERAVAWNMLSTNPARVGVTNPQRRLREQRPFETWDELERVALKLGPRTGPPVLFAATTGLRPGEWTALEHRDIDLEARGRYFDLHNFRAREWRPAQQAAGIEPAATPRPISHPLPPAGQKSRAHPARSSDALATSRSPD